MSYLLIIECLAVVASAIYGVLLAARKEMERQEAPQPMWFYLTPGDR